MPVDERRRDAHVVPAVDERGGADEADDHAELAPPRATYSVPQPVDALDEHVLERHAAPKATVARIAIFAAASSAGHVLGGVGLRVAEALRLRERLRVVRALLHPREHEVRRAVDDAEHAVDVLTIIASRSTFTTGIAAHTLASKRSWTPALRRGREQLRAAPRDQLLVRRDDRLAGAQQLEHVAAASARRRPSPRRRARSTSRRRSRRSRRSGCRRAARTRARAPGRGRAPARRAAGGRSRARCRRRSRAASGRRPRRRCRSRAARQGRRPGRPSRGR